MASKVEICNGALQYLGETLVTAVDPAYNQASRQLSAAWDRVRRATIRSHPWNSTTARKNLAKLSAAPAWGYDYQYELPADCLCVFDIDDDDRTETAWRVEGRRLLCDLDSPLGILYGRDITATATFDPMLVEALSLGMAIAVCEPLTGSSTKKSELEQKWELFLKMAKQVDGREGSPGALQEDDWVLARVRR